MSNYNTAAQTSKWLQTTHNLQPAYDVEVKGKG